MENEGIRVVPDPLRAGKTVPTPVAFHPFSIHVLSLLMSFSVFGTLARLGIHALATYQGDSIFPLAWVQAVGCAIMGFALALRQPITLFYGPLYTAITTGFCGSLTTFSSWQLDVFSAWANASGFHRIWIYDIVDGLTRTVFTLAASLASFGLGVHLGTPVASRMPVLPSPSPFVRWIITIVSITVYVLTIPFFVHLNHTWRPLVTAAIMFSFPGTLIRYILSTRLNHTLKAFPVGTLIANETATAILAACHIIQRAHSPPAPVSCSILQGYIDGFCGCLSTISSFTAEIRTLGSKKAWIYLIVSFGAGQMILLVMLGPAWWTGRIKENTMCTFG
ncbi:hypothetical protein K439DRAFT_1326892 [Ramaria rubella]|nr:hypothetical protein K439DRAFT_1326892 [Ramaria rubella]